MEGPKENTRAVALRKTGVTGLSVKGPEEITRRIVLLGKSGSGKSSLANTLFGEKDTFKVGILANSETKLCQSETKTINGRSIQLVDTPGFFDTDSNKIESYSELLKCITECAPGPHAFLLMFTLARFTKQEQDVVNQMVNEHFGEEALKYTTVVFTHGDDLPEGMSIEKWVQTNEPLKNLVEKCGGRCCVIDNKHWKNSQVKYRNNEYQIEQLLQTIDQTVRENGGGYYTNELLQIVQKQIEEKKVHFKRFSPNIPEEDHFRKAKEAVYNLLFNFFVKGNMKDVTVGAILGAFLGGAAGVALAQYFCASYLVTCVAAGAGAAVGVPVGALGAALVSEYYEPVANAVQDAATYLAKAFEHYKFD